MYIFHTKKDRDAQGLYKAPCTVYRNLDVSGVKCNLVLTSHQKRFPYFRSISRCKQHYNHVKLESFTAMKIHVVVFWITTLCSDVGYQHFKGPCCLHLQGE
jgi:hypothetical protein